MNFGITSILLLFYCGYWIVHDTQPFEVKWIVLLVVGIFFLESLLASTLKAASNKIEKESKNIEKTVPRLEKRLEKLEKDAIGRTDEK